MGIYIDFFSANVTTQGNIIANSTIDGILYQNSSGEIRDNLMLNNSRDSLLRGQVVVRGNSDVTAMTGNRLYAQSSDALSLDLEDVNDLSGSNNNYFFNPYLTNHVGAGGQISFEQWQNQSGQDGGSVTNWFELNDQDTPLGRLFYNDTEEHITVDLGASTYRDLDQNLVAGSFTLPPFTGRILVVDSECVPTATVSGGATLCLGETTQLEVALTGTAPWSLTWSDGFVQNNIATSPATRNVDPQMTTVYSLTAFNDSICEGTAVGSATVIVSADDPLSLSPSGSAQGLQPLIFTATWPCSLNVTQTQWFLNGNLAASDVNPITLTSRLSSTSTLELVLQLDGGGSETTSTTILVPQHAQTNLDLNGDGCNTLADLHMLADQWLAASSSDPNNDGIVDVRDLLYINTDQTGSCP
jgi:parallel beta-helix repeat protein